MTSTRGLMMEVAPYGRLPMSKTYLFPEGAARLPGFCSLVGGGCNLTGMQRKVNRCCHQHSRWQTMIQNSLTQLAENGSTISANVDKEPHKYFDQVMITVRSGDGGHGAVLSLPRTTMKGLSKNTDRDLFHKRRKMKRETDGTVILPMGGHGGDVVIIASDSEDNLLEFHKKKRHFAKRGGNVDAMGYLSPLLEDGSAAPALQIPVPVGTVVKRKRGGKLLADLVRAGDKVLVARGGRGGISLVEIPKGNKGHLRPIKAPTLKDPDDKALVLGAPGEEVTLELTLRVVADVGLVGLPNAGKSSLLAAVTRAKPEIAEYPFTTLMPNLGHLPGSSEEVDGGFSKGPKMADLPGLIKGAHLGKGLGRMFLRHLRRTRIVVHVVDASSEDPLEDYRILCEELQMYNPDYLERPHIVVLNKLDIPEAAARFESLKEQILMLGTQSTNPPESDDNRSDDPLMDYGASSVDAREYFFSQQEPVRKFPHAAAIAGISALEGMGIEDLLITIRSTLESTDSKSKKPVQRRLQPKPEMYVPPQWEL
ncbi:hypothetical protein GOP47_0001383 [Adiantum capillus-veneris]|uniref:GTP-binding protein OBGC2 n=1 Tax=Adiantum capillus-veneris TaxID=13818 RepID=A0A9D4ZQN8_ADICA|nr:hypothetical protein GOP47_0001383 [Adiantum capillus-veneris]